MGARDSEVQKLGKAEFRNVELGGEEVAEPRQCVFGAVVADFLYKLFYKAAT